MEPKKTKTLCLPLAKKKEFREMSEKCLLVSHQSRSPESVILQADLTETAAEVYSPQLRSAETHTQETAALGSSGSEAAEAAVPVPQLSTFPSSHLQAKPELRAGAGQGGAETRMQPKDKATGKLHLLLWRKSLQIHGETRDSVVAMDYALSC